MIQSRKTMIACAALAGLYAGAITSAKAATSTASDGGMKVVNALTMGEKASCSGKDGCKATHDCKGKNACKGQGGCKSGDNGCKGKNSCKGKGGCAAKETPTPTPS
ncbi:MAG TPA: hypothetical protein VIT91_18850 [Chthoniobacterales bacterium]